MHRILTKVAAAAAATFALSTASAAGLFSVDETVINPLTPFFASQLENVKAIDGNYQERLVITGPGTFASAAWFELTTFIKEDDSAFSGTALNNAKTLPGPITTDAYRMYGLFTATGTIDSSGDITFVGTSAEFKLYADPDADLTIGFASSTLTDLTFALGNTGEDELLARSDLLVAGDGSFSPGSFAKGDFAILFSELNEIGGSESTNGLTSLGKNYFYEPDPFYVYARTSGQFDSFTIPDVGAAVELDGNLRITFIPEPGSLALVGLALAGLGAAARRRRG